jgi:hypothetical protein
MSISFYNAQPALETGGERSPLLDRWGVAKRRGGGSKKDLFLDQPPRLRDIRRLLGLYLVAQPPLLSRRGDRREAFFVSNIPKETP